MKSLQLLEYEAKPLQNEQNAESDISAMMPWFRTAYAGETPFMGIASNQPVVDGVIVCAPLPRIGGTKIG